MTGAAKTSLKDIPTMDLTAEIERRRAELRQKYGPCALHIKFRVCKGCGGLFGAREIRSHKCAVPVRMR